jgi:error-prone DNA polymerase
VNHSEWDCSLEPEPASAEALALRLGLRMVAGLAQEDGQAIVKARRSGNGAPFASLEEMARRAGVGRPALEALAAADAFGSLGQGRRLALWEAAAVESKGASIGPLFDATASEGPVLPEPSASLPAEREGEAVVDAAGLTLRSHPLALLRPALDRLGLHDTREACRLATRGLSSKSIGR